MAWAGGPTFCRLHDGAEGWYPALRATEVELRDGSHDASGLAARHTRHGGVISKQSEARSPEAASEAAGLLDVVHHA